MPKARTPRGMPKKMPAQMPPEGMHQMPGGMMMKDSDMKSMMGKTGKAGKKPTKRAKKSY